MIAIVKYYDLTKEQVNEFIEECCEDRDYVPDYEDVEESLMEFCASACMDSFEVTSDEEVSEIYDRIKKKIEGDAKRQLKRKITELEKEIAKSRKELKTAQEELWKMGE